MKGSEIGDGIGVGAHGLMSGSWLQERAGKSSSLETESSGMALSWTKCFSKLLTFPTFLENIFFN